MTRNWGGNFSVIREIAERGQTILGIPNFTVREQLFTYLVESYEQTGLFVTDLSQLNQLMLNMAYNGDWEPLFTYIASELKTQSRIREYIDGESHIKGFLLAYMGLTKCYQIIPEWEANKGYADFYFPPSPTVTQTLGGAKLRLITVIFRTWELALTEEVAV